MFYESTLFTKEFSSASFNVSCITLAMTSVKVGWLVLSHSQALSPDSGGDLGKDSGTPTPPESRAAIRGALRGMSDLAVIWGVGPAREGKHCDRTPFALG